MTTATRHRSSIAANDATRRLPLIVAGGALVIIVLAVVTLATRAGPAAPKAASAHALAGLIARENLGCSDFKPVPAPAQSQAQAGDLGQCTVEGQQVDMAVFTSAKARDQGLVARLKGCIARRAFNTRSTATFNYIVGPNWLLAAAMVGTLDNVNHGLHGDLRKSPC